MASLRGTESMLYVWDTTDTAWRPIGCITSNSFTSTLNMLESVTKCDPAGRKYIPDDIQQTVSVDGEIVDTTSVGGDTTKASWDYLKALQKTQQANATPSEFWYDAGIEDTDYYMDAYITDLNHEAPRDGFMTFSATLQVDGVDTTTNPHPTT